MGFEDIPTLLRDAHHWVMRKEKKPCDILGKSGGWQNPDFWISFDDAHNALEMTPWKFSGMGYIIAREEGRGDKQIIGIDFDCCRSPKAGENWTSPRVLAILQKLNSYTEVSLSGTGYHVWVIGKLPAGVDSMESEGYPLEDLPETVRVFIQALKKTATRSDTIELYEDGPRHFAVTGKRDPAYSANIEERQDVLDELLKLCRPPKKAKAGQAGAGTEGGQGAGARPGSDEMPGWAGEMEKEARAGRLPHISILNVATKAGFVQTEESGGQIIGYLPLLGSSTGRNIVINEAENTYCWMHSGINAGGDPWVFLAHVCGAAPWDAPGEGLLADPDIKARTIAHAKAQGFIPEDALPPHIKEITLESKAGSIGILNAPGHKHNGAICQMQTVESKENGTSVQPRFISDCAVYIHTETTEDGKTEFVLKGRGRKDGRLCSFTAVPEQLNDPRKLHSLLMHQFGGLNRIFKLSTDVLQQISRDICRKERVTSPRWRDNTPLVPGLGELVPDVEFKLSQLTPAEVTPGDLEEAKDLFKHILEHRRYSPLLITAILGAPVMARWFKNDRFGIALWGRTGSNKTTIALLYSTIYGQGFLDERTMLKHGQQGGTAVGAMESILQAGILPRIIDNVKATDPKDFQRYVSLVHAIIEGGEKLRGKKDGGLREIHEYLTTPIITGEIKPSEASTSARILNLAWSKVEDNGNLTYLQGHSEKMPVVGYHWLRFLAGSSRDVRGGFDQARAAKTSELARRGYVNPGRLATIYCLMRGLWGLIKESPLGDVAQEHDKLFLEVLDEAIAAQGDEVNNETELAKFLSAVEELRVSRPELFMVGDMPAASGKAIGKETDLGTFLFPAETLAILKQLGVFGQAPSRDSITKALVEEGLLRPFIKGKASNRIKINGAYVYGWWLRAGWDSEEGMGPNDNEPQDPTWDPKNRQAEPQGSQRSQGSHENERKINGKKSEQTIVTDSNKIHSHKNMGPLGPLPKKSNSNTSIDIDIVGVPIGVPEGSQGSYEHEDKDCSKCNVALKGDKTAIKCNPCTYLGEAKA